MAAKHFPSADYLRQCFDYDPETGLFRWRVRPQSHFATAAACAAWNKRFAGAPALRNKMRNGYLIGRVSLDGAYIKMLAHRVAWTLMAGASPEDQIDHADRDRSNNRWANLREADQSQNNWNSADQQRELPRGVYPNGNGFSARMTHRGVRVHLGTFETPEEASKVWQRAAQVRRHEFAEAA